MSLRGGKTAFSTEDGVADPEQEKEAYSMDVVGKVFGSGVKTLRDLDDEIKKVGKAVNIILRKAEAGRKMVVEDEREYSR